VREGTSGHCPSHQKIVLSAVLGHGATDGPKGDGLPCLDDSLDPLEIQVFEHDPLPTSVGEYETRPVALQIEVARLIVDGGPFANPLFGRRSCRSRGVFHVYRRALRDLSLKQRWVRGGPYEGRRHGQWEEHASKAQRPPSGKGTRSVHGNFGIGVDENYRPDLDGVCEGALNNASAHLDRRSAVETESNTIATPAVTTDTFLSTPVAERFYSVSSSNHFVVPIGQWRRFAPWTIRTSQR